MKRNLFLATLAASLLMLFMLPSCKKSNDAPSRSALLVGVWQAYQQGVDANGNGTWDASERTNVVNITMSGISIKLDNVTLKDDKTGSATATLLGSPTTMPLTWSLLNNDNDLQVVVTTLAGPYTLSGTIVSLNESELILRQSTTGSASYISFIKQ